MSVKLRFVRVGKKNRPAYRLCAIESRRARDGQYLENLGFYDPYIVDEKKKVRIDKERAEYWLRVGAEPSKTVLHFFKLEKVAGLIRSKPKRNRRKKATKAPGAAAHASPVGAAPSAAGKPGKKPKPPKKPKAPKSSAPGAPES